MYLFKSTACILQANVSISGSTNYLGIAIFIGAILVLTFMFFYFLKRTDRYVEQKEQERLAKLNNNPAVIHEDPTDEVAAAIALAISMYKIQLTEQENLTVTIQKVSKMYSPWSSKIYSLRQLPR